MLKEMLKMLDLVDLISRLKTKIKLDLIYTFKGRTMDKLLLNLSR